METVTASADKFAANVLPIIREAQKAGATTLRDIAAVLNARGSPRLAVVCGTPRPLATSLSGRKKGQHARDRRICAGHDCHRPRLVRAHWARSGGRRRRSLAARALHLSGTAGGSHRNQWALMEKMSLPFSHGS